MITRLKGVAEVTAIAIVTRIDFDRFDNVKQFTAFLDLTPRQRTSGSSVRGCTRLSKTGDPELRMYLCAQSARRFNPYVQPCCARWESQGLTGLLCALAHQLARVIYECVKSRQAPHFGVLPEAG